MTTPERATNRFVRATCRWGVGALMLAPLVLAPLAMYQRSPPRDAALLALGGLYLALLGLLVAVIFHEIGHAVAARLSGGTILRFMVGSIWWTNRRRGGRLSFRFALTGPSGLVMVIPDLEKPVRRQMIAMILGGPAANLVLALLTAVCIAPLMHQSLLAGVVGLSFLACNAVMGLGNMLPIGKTLPSDGSQFWLWWKHPERCVEERRSLEISGRLLRGETAATLPYTELQTLAQSEKPARRFLMGYLLLKRAQEMRDRVEFDRLYAAYSKDNAGLDAAQRKAVAALWACFHYEQAYERALDGSPELAHRLMVQKAWKKIPGRFRWRVEAAVALNAGQYDEAQRLFLKLRKEIDGELEVATRITESVMLEEMQRRCREALAARAQGSVSNPS